MANVTIEIKIRNGKLFISHDPDDLYLRSHRVAVELKLNGTVKLTSKSEIKIKMKHLGKYDVGEWKQSNNSIVGYEIAVRTEDKAMSLENVLCLPKGHVMKRGPEERVGHNEVGNGARLWVGGKDIAYFPLDEPSAYTAVLGRTTKEHDWNKEFRVFVRAKGTYTAEELESALGTYREEPPKTSAKRSKSRDRSGTRRRSRARRRSRTKHGPPSENSDSSTEQPSSGE